MESKGNKYVIYLDTGGTFSDAVIIGQDGSFVTGKASTTPEDLEGVPVIDPMLAAIKFGELMVDLCKAGLPFVSRKGLYFKAPDSELKDFLGGSFRR